MSKRNLIPLFIPHAGCPNACVFCDQRKITGMDTPVTPEMVQEQIREGLSHAGEGCEVAFYGGSFTALLPETQETLLGAATPFLRSGEVSTLRVSTRPDAIDEQVCSRLRTYGVKTVELGCQSVDDHVLELSGRGHTGADIVRAARLLKREGFSLILQMMTGLPGDDGEASRQTARTLAALKPDGVRIYPTVVLKGTELERQMLLGNYREHRLEDAVPLCAELYELFLAAGIPVIRLGLNPTEDLSGGEAVAGAYHPALGELVLSEMFLKRARILLREKKPLEGAVLSVHPSRISVMVGQKRRNLRALQEEFGLKWIKVVPGGEELWEIALKNA